MSRGASRTAEPVHAHAAVLRPRRAALIAWLSRLVLVAILLGTAWSLHAARAAATGTVPSGGAAVRADDVTAPRAGRTHTATLQALKSAVADVDARLLGIDVRRGGPSIATVELTVTTRGDRAEDIQRVVEAIGRSGLDDVRLRSVTPTPEGHRLDVGAMSAIATAPLPGIGTDGGRPMAVVLSEVVDRSGADLRRLEMPVSAEEPVRMALAGSARLVIAALGIVEHEVSAPMRVESISVRAGAADGWELGLTFRPRVLAPFGPTS